MTSHPGTWHAALSKGPIDPDSDRWHGIPIRIAGKHWKPAERIIDATRFNSVEELKRALEEAHPKLDMERVIILPRCACHRPAVEVFRGEYRCDYCKRIEDKMGSDYPDTGAQGEYDRMRGLRQRYGLTMQRYRIGVSAHALSYVR